MSRFPYNDPQGWQCQIAGINVNLKVLRVLLKGLKSSIKLDKKPAVGRNGASLTYQGENLAEWTIELTATNENGWIILEAITAIAAKAKGDWLDVYHPLLAAREITKMVVESIDGPEFDGGMMTTTFACVQYAKPEKKTVSAASKASTLKVAVPGTEYNGVGSGEEFGPPQRPASPAATKPKP